MCHRINPGDCFVQVCISENRQDRPENFLLHYLVFKSNIIHYRRLNLECICIAPATEDYFVLVDEAAYSVKMLLVNDFSVIGIGKRHFAELFPDLLLNLGYQFIFYFPVTENIIRCYTGLAAV